MRLMLPTVRTVLIHLIIQETKLAGRLAIYLDKEIYNIEAIQKALYTYSDIVSGLIEVNSNNDKQYILNLELLDASNDNIDNIKKDLLNEINDHCIRIKISEETKDIRNLILAHAFSKTPLVENNE